MIATCRHRRVRRWSCAAAVVAPFLLVGCAQDLTQPTLPASALALEQPLPAAGQSARRVASIRQLSEPVVVDAPSTVKAGEPATVAVTTYSGGCITEDTTVVDMHGLSADVVPFQIVYKPKPNEACTSELQANSRQADVVFAQPGSATVRVYGRSYPDGGIIVVTRHIMVQ